MNWQLYILYTIWWQHNTLKLSTLFNKKKYNFENKFDNGTGS